MKDLIFKNWKTTLMALISFVVTILVTYGVITPSESADLNGLIAKLWTNIQEIIAIITGIFLLFAKDYDK